MSQTDFETYLDTLNYNIKKSITVHATYNYLINIKQI